MDPHDPERISLYLDGELDPAEQARLEEHLAGCASCRATRDAFLKLRELLRAESEPAVPADRLAQRRALREILRDRPPETFWRRPVTLPAPGLAALVVALVVALGALVIERLPLRPATPPATGGEEASAPGDAEPATKSTFDPARFDQGGRLEIYVARHLPPARDEER
jgi:anti-sigma factor RsiW